jgi:hypothetical protein
MATKSIQLLESTRREQETNNTSFDKVQNNKHTSADEQQNTDRNKLKEDFKIM